MGLVNRLGSLPRNSVVRLTDHLDMPLVVDWDVKTINQINSKHSDLHFHSVHSAHHFVSFTDSCAQANFNFQQI